MKVPLYEKFITHLNKFIWPLYASLNKKSFQMRIRFKKLTDIGHATWLSNWEEIDFFYRAMTHSNLSSF